MNLMWVDWSMGVNDIYNLQLESVSLVNLPLRIYEIIIRLCSISLYPFRTGQSFFGLFYLYLLLLHGLIFIHKSSVFS